MLYGEILETRSGVAVTVDSDIVYPDNLYLNIGDFSLGCYIRLPNTPKEAWLELDRMATLRDLAKIEQAIKVFKEALGS